MPVDFYAIPCNNLQGNCQDEPIQCLQAIHSNTFGISDVWGGNNLPAKINAINPDSDTDFIVVNNSNKEVSFNVITSYSIHYTKLYEWEIKEVFMRHGLLLEEMEYFQ